MSPLLFFVILLIFPIHSISTSSSLVGINYGLVADNLPSPSTVPPLLHSLSIGRIRLYDADPTVLRSFANTGFEFIVGLPDRCILKAASDPSFSLTWLKSNVQAYLPNTKIVAITMGNEVLTNNDTVYAHSLLPAIDNLYSALVYLNLHKQVQITTAHSVAILSSSYPPSSGKFKQELLPLLCPLLQFHARTGSPFLINAYPFFAYKSDPKRVPLDYALFEPNAGVTDTATGLKYDNMLFAQIDAVYSAMRAAGTARGVEVRVSETGWPSGGDEDEAGATPENAAKYNGNLMKLVMGNKGTPLVPKTPVRVYVFALFNENQKPGPGSERNYGLFKPDGTPAYKLDIDVPPEDDGSSNTTGGGGGGGGYPGGGASAPPDYYDISSAALVWQWQQRVGTMVGMGLLLLLSSCVM